MKNVTTSSALVVLGLAACGAPNTPLTQSQGGTPSPATAGAPSRKSAAQFQLRVDPATGSVTQIGTSGRGIHTPAVVVQDGNPGANPAETFHLVTTNAIIGDGMNGCPATDNCFTVEARSFLTRAAGQVTLVVDAISPSRSMSNGDAAPPGSGLSSPYGLTTFGDIAAGGTATEEMRFTLPNLDPYTVVLGLYETDPSPGGNCSDVAIAVCQNMGWTVVGWPTSFPNGPGGSIFCTIDGRGAGNDCDTCATYNQIVWSNVAVDACSSGQVFAPGNIYSSHEVCACVPNVPVCGTWDMAGCTPD